MDSRPLTWQTKRMTGNALEDVSEISASKNTVGSFTFSTIAPDWFTLVFT